VAALAAAGAIVFALVYFLLLPTSSPKPFALTTPATSTSPEAATTTSTTASTASGLGGTWQIGTGSQAGYRVREKLVFLPAESDAVGRTSQITGGATFTEQAATVTVKSASFSIAVNTLKSDRSQRDEKIHSIALESDRYPTATFALSHPVVIPASQLSGHVAHTSVTGVVEIHGVSKQVSIPVEMTLDGSTIEAAGALTFPWSEFGMTAPSIGGFVSVTEHATLEFDLRLRRA